jgi:peroxiredoxin
MRFFVLAATGSLAAMLFVAGGVPADASPLLVGSPAPAFELEDASGREVRLEDFKGKVVLISFWAPWCDLCRVELQELESLYKKYKRDGFEVIGIGLDTSTEGVTKMLRKVPLTYRVISDDKGKAADAYRVSGVPLSFFVGRDGVIRHRHAGFGQESLPLYMQEIEELLKQR